MSSQFVDTNYTLAVLCENNTAPHAQRNLYRKKLVSENGTSFWYKFLAGNRTQLYSSTETVWHVTQTVQCDWLESCFCARNCDELASNFSCKFLVHPILVYMSTVGLAVLYMCVF